MRTTKKTPSTTDFHLCSFTIVIMKDATQNFPILNRTTGHKAKKLHLRENLPMNKQNIAQVSDISIIIMLIFLMPHRGLLDTSVFQQLRYAASRIMLELYLGMELPSRPVSRITPPKHARNAEIRALYQAGETLRTLADLFGISEQRVHQIVQGRRK